MSFTFPDPLVTTEFTAANGITYLWDDDSNGPGKWVVKSFLQDGVLVDLSPIPPTRPDRPDGPNDGDLWFDTSPDELTLYVYSEDSTAWIPAAPPTTLEGRVAENEALQIQIVQRLQANEVLTNLHSNELLTLRSEITELEEQVNLLNEIVKGSVLKYTFDNNLGQAVSRPGEISTNSGFWTSVNKFSFGTADADGTATPAISNNSIIETYNARDNKTNRYTVTNASNAPTVVEVQYISGDYFYTVGDELEVNIY